MSGTHIIARVGYARLRVDTGLAISNKQREEEIMEDIRCGQTKCFANKCGECSALSDTNFKGRICPFFKTKEQRNSEIRNAVKVR